MPESRRHDVHGDAGLEEVRGPVGAQGVRMREALRHGGAQAVAPHELVDRLAGEGEGIFA